MPQAEQFAANLAMMFSDSPFLERFERAAKAGFSTIECSTPELFGSPAADCGAALRAAGLRCALFNMPPGETGGMCAQPGLEGEFASSVDTTLEYCAALGCPAVHCMAGPLPPDATADDVARHRAVYVANLRALAPKFTAAGVVACLEPLNPRTHNPDYFLKSNDMAAEIIAELNLPCVRLQFDFFHTQLISGDVTIQFRKHQAIVGHVQIAGVPDRFEPDETQELNYPFILAEMDRLGWEGAIGCEYTAREGPAKTEEGMGWLKPYGVVPRL